MAEQSTDEMSRFLGTVRCPQDLREYLENLRKNGNAVSLSNYLNGIMHEKGLLLRNVVAECNLEQHYAYQIINGNKPNPSRIKVLALAIACRMTLEQTQRALSISKNAILFPDNPFDAIVIFNISQSNWSLFDINEQLLSEGLPILE